MVSKRTARIMRVTIFASLLIAGVVTAFKLGLKDKLSAALHWVDRNKIPGVGVTILTYLISCILLLPESVLALGAGAVFGVIGGSVIIWVSAMLTITICFHIGRYLLQEWVEDAAKSNNMWDAVDLVMKQKGWQIVILLHIAPFVPFTAMNYVMGATDMPFSTYLWASAVGTIPGIVGFTYLGSAAADLPSIIRGEVGPSRGWQIAIIVVSVLATVAALVLLTWYAKKEIERKLAEQQEGPEGGDLSEGLLPRQDVESGPHVVDKKGYSYVKTRVEE